jgi:hypothetical protein
VGTFSSAITKRLHRGADPIGHLSSREGKEETFDLVLTQLRDFVTSFRTGRFSIDVLIAGPQA